MFSRTSLLRSAKGTWLNCGYLQPKECGWQFLRSQGFYFLFLFSISVIYGPVNLPEKLWTQSALPCPCEKQTWLSGGQGRSKNMMPCAPGDPDMGAAAPWWSARLSSSTSGSCAHQHPSSWHERWDQSYSLLFCFFFPHLPCDLWFSLDKMSIFKKITHFHSGLLSSTFVLILEHLSIWEMTPHLAYPHPPNRDGQKAPFGMCIWPGCWLEMPLRSGQHVDNLGRGSSCSSCS